jgi:hypothetical protein
MKVGDRYWLRFDHDTVVEITDYDAPWTGDPDDSLEWRHIAGPGTGQGPFVGSWRHFTHYYEPAPVRLSDRLVALHLPEPDYPDGSLYALREWQEDVDNAVQCFDFWRDRGVTVLTVLIYERMNDNARAMYHQLCEIERLRRS